MILGISIGNTNLRYAVFQKGSVLRHGCMKISERPMGDLEWAEAEGIKTAIVASVRPDLLEGLEHSLARRETEVRVAGRDFAVPIKNLYDCPEEVGVDRLLAVLAATRLYPGEGVIVVDFGTAMTINVGSPAGEFVGGVIGIGASSAARALREHAPRLPPVDLGAADGQLARNTARAVNNGIVWQVAGGVDSILRRVRALYPWASRGIATGGDAELLAPWIDGIERVAPFLVLEGLYQAYCG